MDYKAKQPATIELSDLPELLASLRHEVARLSERVAALEAVNQSNGQEKQVPKHAEVVGPQEVSLDDEIVVVIGAAIAAFLGKVPRIHQIRLIGTTSWAQQGRVTIQTSHALPVSHTRSEH